MKILDFQKIVSLNISPKDCVSWTRSAFLTKYEAVLPPKISTKIPGNIFFNTMPCLIPSISRFGVKEVSRFPNRTPSLASELMLYDSESGELLAMLDATWITAMRTGAVAALAIQTFKTSNASVYAFTGLGNTARATMECLLAISPAEPITVKLMRYKNQAENFIERFKAHKHLTFVIIDTAEELIKDSDVIVSCVTAYDEPLAKDEFFKEGVLLVPVHTRGFQNCDLFFDKVFADDIPHICGFKNFDKFKQIAELSEVLLGKKSGRENNSERIIAYNIGIALHDVYFAAKIYEHCKNLEDINLAQPTEKFWV
jgi:Predicted ornithine cyclodeaminase, mu-crystallin homolog